MIAKEARECECANRETSLLAVYVHPNVSMSDAQLERAATAPSYRWMALSALEDIRR